MSAPPRSHEECVASKVAPHNAAPRPASDCSHDVLWRQLPPPSRTTRIGDILDLVSQAWVVRFSYLLLVTYLCRQPPAGVGRYYGFLYVSLLTRVGRYQAVAPTY